MGIHGGLKPDDWKRWGQFTTFKQNAEDLLRRELRPAQIIYCSPLVDPYQPAERDAVRMPRLLAALIDSPPARFVIQTRSPLILRDVPLLQELSRRTALRVSFSVTTDRDDIRRLYEPHCEPIEQRLGAITDLHAAGILVHATLAPLLPCNAGRLARIVLDATNQDLIGDPLHVRSVKPRGATTRDAAWKIAEHHGHQEWFDPASVQQAIEAIQSEAAQRGRKFVLGVDGFGLLTR